MNSLLKRMSAGLLALFMVVSLLVGVIPADTFAANYTYNTGTRHDYDVALSSQAQAYYTGDYTWDKLSNLAGGNENCLDMDNPLFDALHDLMTDTMTNRVTYKSLPDYWKYTDASKGSSGTIWFYVDNTGSGSMSREHVWPKSHASFHEKDGGADLHHLRPSISNVNSSRGNLIMGNVKGKSGASVYQYGGKTVLYRTSSMCEVNDNIKGDVARIFLYVWCRWEEPNLFMNTPNPVIGPNDSQNDGGKVIESLDTLLEWCALDPVDTWEMSRNDQIENVQGNRNVFIDYPEFAWLVFGQDVPTDLDTPSNNASGGISGNPTGGNSGGTTTPPTNPPATNPPATQATIPPATQSAGSQSATQPNAAPDATQPGVTPGASQPGGAPDASQPGTSEGASQPVSTKPKQPAPLPTNPVPDFEEPEKDNSTLWIIISIVAVVLIGGAVAAVIIIKRKKNVTEAANSAAEVPIEEASVQEAPAEETSIETTEENE